MGAQPDVVFDADTPFIFNGLTVNRNISSIEVVLRSPDIASSGKQAMLSDIQVICRGNLAIGPDIYKITGTTDITSIVATGHWGRRVTLIFGDILTFTDGSNLKLEGNLVTTDRNRNKCAFALVIAHLCPG